MKATEFYDEILVAEQDVTVRIGSTRSAAKKDIAAGREVGRIYAHVERPGGVWWQLYTSDGLNNEFVKHDAAKLEVRKGGINPVNLVNQAFEGIKYAFDEVTDRTFDLAKLALLGAGIYFAFLFWFNFK